MNLESYNFNVPEFVRSADPASFDTQSDDALVVGGLRIDNPAAAWVAGAEIRKFASRYADAGVCRLIKEACSLFNIDDSMFTPAITANAVEISDGTHSVSFNVNDSESLNAAASALLSKRAGLPYTFASECADALLGMSRDNGYSFNRENQVAIRKLAGDYNVDFEAGRELLSATAKEAADCGMTSHAEILKKIASLCTNDCSPEMAPYFITAIDEFRQGARHLRKSASSDNRFPEDVFYKSNAEHTAKLANRKLYIKGSDTPVTALSVSSNIGSISKWASICGYSISQSDTPEDIVSAVGKMPAALRDEFIDLFGDR
jgi:hypothetical protein